jgi:hypothetical protein|tara:strand:- start:748 stop:1020 length:273 start_codon:yes stop_codon:yes gene_type:complete
MRDGMTKEHPVYRAKFYIQELEKYASWPEYLAYYKEQDDKIMQFSHFCLQMWANYMNDKFKKKEAPLSYKEYLNKYQDLLKEGYNVRPKN